MTNFGKLRQRGIIVCVASKNDEDKAKEPFLKHPDMILKLDDIAVFQANWETKVDNIRTIQSILNIAFDSMVFLDDNPFERNIVREHIPGITVPELPEDPAEYLEYLYSLNLFETANYIALDTGKSYQASYVAGDPVSDLAVLKVDGRGLPAAEFGESDLLTVGDKVYAIGNPLGYELWGTMTDGIVSAVDRDVQVDGRTMTCTTEGFTRR